MELKALMQKLRLSSPSVEAGRINWLWLILPMDNTTEENDVIEAEVIDSTLIQPKEKLKAFIEANTESVPLKHYKG